MMGKTTSALTAVVVALLIGACGNSNESSSSGGKVKPPTITTDEHGQAKVTVTDEAVADEQCEAMQSGGQWPEDVNDDVVYFVLEDGSTYMSCGRG